MASTTIRATWTFVLVLLSFVGLVVSYAVEYRAEAAEIKTEEFCGDQRCPSASIFSYHRCVGKPPNERCDQHVRIWVWYVLSVLAAIVCGCCCLCCCCCGMPTVGL